MCNLYNYTRNVDGVRAVTRATIDRSGFNEPSIFAYPNRYAPIVRVGVDGEREIVRARWGMPSPAFALKGKAYDYGVTNIRNTASPHWRRWLGPESRCTSWTRIRRRWEGGRMAWQSCDRCGAQGVVNDSISLVTCPECHGRCGYYVSGRPGEEGGGGRAPGGEFHAVSLWRFVASCIFAYFFTPHLMSIFPALGRLLEYSLFAPMLAVLIITLGAVTIYSNSILPVLNTLAAHSIASHYFGPSAGTYIAATVATASIGYWSPVIWLAGRFSEDGRALRILRATTVILAIGAFALWANRHGLF